MIYICKYLIDVNTWYINDDISLHPIVFADRESLFIVKVTISLLNSEIIVHFLPIMQKQYDHKINKLFKDCLFLQSRSVAAHSFQNNLASMYFRMLIIPHIFTHSLCPSRQICSMVPTTTAIATSIDMKHSVFFHPYLHFSRLITLIGILQSYRHRKTNLSQTCSTLPFVCLVCILKRIVLG